MTTDTHHQYEVYGKQALIFFSYYDFKMPTILSKAKAVNSLPKPLSLAFSNVRGLRSNFPFVESFLHTSSPDILALCETNLNSSISSSDFSVDGYLPLSRLDSDTHMHGLGVFVRDTLPIARVPDLESPNHAFMCFRVALLHSTTFIYFLYRSPSSPDCSVLGSVSDSIDKALSEIPSANFVVCGDFNVHHVEWLRHSSGTDAPGVESFNFSVSHNLTQIVDFPTRFPENDAHSPSLLDLCLLSDPTECHATCFPPLGNSDHVVVSISLQLKAGQPTDHPSHRTSYNYQRADWDSCRDLLRDIPINDILAMPVDRCASEISEWIQVCIDAYVPHRTYQVRPHSSPWFSPACAAAIAHRNHHFHLFRREDSIENKRLFSTARNRCKNVLQNARDNYQESVKAKISTQRLGSREFWKIFNSVTKKGKSVIPPLLDGPRVVSSTRGKAEILASSFARNCTLPVSGQYLPDFPSRSNTFLDDVVITPDNVTEKIATLDSSSASGPDRIPVLFLKQCSPELSDIFSRLFTKCLSESCFPSCWKSASVVPVFKNSGDRSDPRNYRPISLLSVISKVFESLINDALVSHLESNCLFSDQQYGFRRNRSTADHLTVITERICKALDGCGVARAIALDISKAFDRVWHAGLLHKLSAYGVRGRVLNIIRSFLQNRNLKVVLDGQSSSTFAINAGVPQGSILGPILFLVFINDLPDKEEIFCDIGIFADDTSIYKCSEGRPGDFEQAELAGSLELDLARFLEWGSDWRVSFNASKTKLLSIHRSRNVDFPQILMGRGNLPEAASFRLLGLTFSNDLTWTDYITSVAKSASMKVGSLFRARGFLTHDAILHIYKSVIRPSMEYCSHIWAGSSARALGLLDRIQRRIVNLVGPALASQLHSLSHRRDVASLSLFYKYFHKQCSEELSNLVPPPKTFHRRTRLATRSHRFTVVPPKCTHSFYANSFFSRTSAIWNALPASCFPDEYDLQSFKKEVNRHLLSS